MNKTLRPGSRSGAVEIPSSKSIAHRLLICAALGDHAVDVRLGGLSADIRATAACLNALGADICPGERKLSVRPLCSGVSDGEKKLLPVGESGSTIRFLLPVAGALGQSVDFVMEGRLPERPLSPFDRVLEDHGMVLRRDGTNLQCEGCLQPGVYSLPGNISSQFFSGLLMALPLLGAESTLRCEGKLESASYVRLTEDTLRLAGVCFERGKDLRGPLWTIPGGQRPRLPAETVTEGDWSNAAFFLCAAAFSGQGIRVSGLRSDSGQGDREILRLLREFGAEITASGREICVRRGNSRPLDVNAEEIPDLVPVLAILCCGAKGSSMIRGAARLRLKESDRLQTTVELIRSLGGTAEELPDGIMIHGSGCLRGGTADAHGDHRIAMSAAVASCLCSERVTVLGAESVEKSYPDFWRDFGALQEENRSECFPENGG